MNSRKSPVRSSGSALKAPPRVRIWESADLAHQAASSDSVCQEAGAAGRDPLILIADLFLDLGRGRACSRAHHLTKREGSTRRASSPATADAVRSRLPRRGQAEARSISSSSASKADELRVHPARKARRRRDVGRRRRSCLRRVAPCLPEHDDPTAVMYSQPCHRPLDDCTCARVAHGEAFARDPAENARPAVARTEPCCRRSRSPRPGTRHPPEDAQRARLREALADVVVRIADQGQLDPQGEPGAERLAGRSSKVNRTVPGGRPSAPWRFVTSSRRRPADGTVTFRIACSPTVGPLARARRSGSSRARRRAGDSCPMRATARAGG